MAGGKYLPRRPSLCEEALLLLANMHSHLGSKICSKLASRSRCSGTIESFRHPCC